VQSVEPRERMKKNKEQEKMYKIYLSLVFSFCTFNTHTQALPRRACMGVFLHDTLGRLMVDSVEKYTSLANTDIRKGDFILEVNEENMNNVLQYKKVVKEIIVPDEVRLKISRGGKEKIISTPTVGRSMDVYPYIEEVLGSVKYGEGELRKIIYKKSKRKKAPGIFFIPGYNCGSIENFPSLYDRALIEEWVEHGYMVYTVEKSGVGDSRNCKPCAEVDLQTDIELYQTAFQDFKKQEAIDSNKLFIWGHSMGGIIAPLVAQHNSVKGIMVYGTVYRPWSEFLLEMHRVQKPLLEHLTFEETETFIRLIQKVYYEFFVLKKTPEQLHNIPEYKSIVETELEYQEGSTNMWGRHWRFWQQLDSINLAQAWQTTSAKVLAMNGDADYIQCSQVEPCLITNAVNSKHPHHATMAIISGVDHLLMSADNFQEAIENFNNKKYVTEPASVELIKATLDWMEEVMDN
jgi:uncharacterized protein